MTPEAEPILEGRVMRDLEPKDRVEEAHGLWELAVTRVALLVENCCSGHPTSLAMMKQCSSEERDAFKNWQAVSREVGA